MFKLDENLLRELGLGALPANEKNRMLGHIYETLEMRVGMKLAEKMTNQQLDEFEQFIDRNDEAGALKWLETNFPNYKQVVADELETLKAEIKQAAPQILAASQQAAAQMAQMPPAAPMQQPMPAQYQAPPPMSPAQPMQPLAPSVPAATPLPPAYPSQDASAQAYAPAPPPPPPPVPIPPPASYPPAPPPNNVVQFPQQGGMPQQAPPAQPPSNPLSQPTDDQPPYQAAA